MRAPGRGACDGRVAPAASSPPTTFHTMTSTTRIQRLRRLADQPKSASVDGQEMTSHSLAEQLALEKYLASEEAAAPADRSRHGFRITKMKAGGGPC